MAEIWKYKIALDDDVRIYYRPADKGGLIERRGICWRLDRICERTGQPDFVQSIAVSPGVFDDKDAARRDALERLSILRCPLERPLDHAIRWILEDI